MIQAKIPAKSEKEEKTKKKVTTEYSHNPHAPLPPLHMLLIYPEIITNLT